MAGRRWVMALVALLVVNGSTAQGPQKYYCASRCSRKNLPCPSPCSACPKIPPCPAPSCPHPECPFIPRLHPCPEPVCSPLPKIPACPEPQVKLTCPHVACPHHSCPACPRCPDILPCPVCPTTPPPTTVLSRITTETHFSDYPDIGSTESPDDYEETSGVGRYKLHYMRDSWGDANSTCSREGAHLAIIDNQIEKELLLRKMSERNINIIHVGFHFSVRSFITALGNSMTDYQKRLWANMEPASGYTYPCTFLSYNGVIVTERCGDNEYFICEKT